LLESQFLVLQNPKQSAHLIQIDELKNS